MRILQIGKYYPPQRGGMETALAELSAGLVQRGHRVRALVSAADSTTRFEILDGVELQRVAEYGKLASVSISPGLPGALRRCFAALDPDVIHLHLPHPLGGVAWLMHGRSRPLVVTYHSDIVRQRFLGRLWAPWRSRILREARAIQVTSESLRDHSSVLAPHRDRCHVIPLGVDVSEWSKAPVASVQRWWDRLGNSFFLFVGRLVYYKGLGVAFEAMRNTSMRLVVAGDGPMREIWEAEAIELGVADRVVFLGEVDPADLTSLYHACSAFLLPSQEPSEAFGIVQLEAMAAGKAVVACKASGGVASIHVEGETALLVPAADPQALRTAMLQVHGNAEFARQLGQNGQKRVAAFFDRDRSIDRTEQMLLQAVNGRRTAP